MAETLPPPPITPPLKLKSAYFHYSTQHLLKDVEIKSQQKLFLGKMSQKTDKRNPYICS
jgi:hypothetical protein